MSVSDANLAANKAFDEYARDNMYKRIFVTDQRALKDYRFGRTDMGYAGCEIIAVHNAGELCRSMIREDKKFDPDGREILHVDKIRGDYIPFSEMIRKAESEGILIRSGRWGSNPLWLPRFASEYGIKLEKLENNLPQSDGIYILSFWNTGKVSDGVHTVCMEIMGDTAVTYNLCYRDSPVSFSLQELTQIFKEKMLIAVFNVTPIT